MRFAYYILYFKRRTTQALIAKKDSLYLSANVISSAVLIGSPVQREKILQIKHKRVENRSKWATAQGSFLQVWSRKARSRDGNLNLIFHVF